MNGNSVEDKKLNPTSLFHFRIRLYLLILLVLLPMYGLVIFTYVEEQRLTIADTQASLLKLVHLIANEQNQSFDNTRHLLAVLGQSRLVQQKLSQCNGVFERYVQEFPFYINLAAATADGNVFCSGVPSLRGKNLASRKYFQKVLETKSFAHGDYRVVENGTVVVNSGYPIFDSNRNITGVVSASNDLSNLEYLLYRMDLPPEATVTVINANGVVLLRYPFPQRWVGKNFRDVPAIKAILQAKNEGIVQAEGLDGMRRLYVFAPVGEETGVPVYLAIGVPINILLIGENQIFIHNMVGLGVVTAIAFLLVWFAGNILVMQRLKVLREINQLKSELISFVSHQLRTPIATIRWYIERILGGTVGAVTDKQREYLEEIHAAGQYMTGLINKFLDIARREMDTLVVVPEYMNLAEISKDIIEEHALAIKKKHLRIEEDYRGDTSMYNDPRLVRVVLENIISNAVKYTPPHGTVRIVAERQNPRMLFTVSDTGYGIPPEDAQKVFEKMFRASNIQEKGVEGSGFGLYVSKFIIEQLGGEITFKSKLNKGTIFYCKFPAGMPKHEKKT